MQEIPFYISEEQRLVSQNREIIEGMLITQKKVLHIAPHLLDQYNINIDTITGLRAIQPLTKDDQI